MELSKGELLILEQVAKGNRNLKSVALALNKSEKQIYVYLKNLISKDFVSLSNGKIEPNKLIHVSLLLQILSKIPNLIPMLSGTGIPILIAILKPAPINEISNKTSYKKTAIYKKLSEAEKRSLVIKDLSTFQINEKMWGELKEFLEEMKKYEFQMDERIPIGSIVYYRKDKEILFSSKEDIDAVKTAFSVYRDYGIELIISKNYYYLPKKELTKDDIMLHSLYVAEKENDLRNIIFISLFYVKYKNEVKINHPIIENLSLVLLGQKIKGYPSYQEIKDRAEVYNIEL